MEGNDKALGKGGRLLLTSAMSEQPARQFGLVIGAGPAIVLEALVDPQADVSAVGLESREHELALAR